MSVKVLADNGYTKVFQPKKHWNSSACNEFVQMIVTKEVLLHGWRDKFGLWQVPFMNKINDIKKDMVAIYRPTPSHAVHNMYELPSVEKTIQYFHAVMGFLPKATRIKAVKSGFYST